MKNGEKKMAASAHDDSAKAENVGPMRGSAEARPEVRGSKETGR
jgi:hypothetical protein